MESEIKGIALIEVLISTVIISTGILAVFMLLSHLIEGHSKVQQYEEAKTVVNNKLEVFKNNLFKSQFTKISSGSENVENESKQVFFLSWIVKETGINQKDISITARWRKNEYKLQHILTWQDPLISLSIASHALSREAKLNFPKETIK